MGRVDLWIIKANVNTKNFFKNHYPIQQLFNYLSTILNIHLNISTSQHLNSSANHKPYHFLKPPGIAQPALIIHYHDHNHIHGHAWNFIP